MNTDRIYIYGKHAVSEALQYRPEAIREIFLKENFTDTDLQKRIAESGTMHSFLKGKQLPPGIDRGTVHQGIVAVVSEKRLIKPYKEFISEFDVSPDTAFLILGEVQDPHNVGAVIRSAAAFGISGVLIPPHNQAQITGAVAKVSAGAVFRVPIVRVSNVNTTLRDLKTKGFWIYGLASDGTTSLQTERFQKPSVFVLGNEGDGLRKMTKEVCDELLSIPQSKTSESFNASVAAAVVLYEWSRQHPNVLT